MKQTFLFDLTIFIVRGKKKETFTKKEKTRNCFLCPLGISTEWLLSASRHSYAHYSTACMFAVFPSPLGEGNELYTIIGIRMQILTFLHKLNEFVEFFKSLINANKRFSISFIAFINQLPIFMINFVIF